MKKILILLLGACLLISSCSKKEINPLKGTTWIHEFKESEHVDAKADAYCFGTDKVEHFAIGKDGKISQQLGVYPYSFRKGRLKIGVVEHKYSEHSIYIRGNLYIKTSQDIFNTGVYAALAVMKNNLKLN